MLNLAALCVDLRAMGLDHWCEPLKRLLPEKLAPRTHGNLPRWLELLSGLPALPVDAVELNSAAVAGSAQDAHPHEVERLRQSLLELAPWRKGPFRLFDLQIDAEWRSNMKWDRLGDAISSLHQRTVLDVGCGNGYYALRMKGAGARFVIGVDPAILHLVQFSAIQKYLQQPRVHVLPLRLQELPAGTGGFDTTFSMGVLYHQRNPHGHLQQLRDTLRPGGELVLETLILPGTGAFDETPSDRYARMRNVWRLPSIERLRQWLDDAGFRQCRVVDVSVTSREEQRSTQWMPFESLDKALQADQPELTIEGLPRPRRALLIAKNPGTPASTPSR